MTHKSNHLEIKQNSISGQLTTKKLAAILGLIIVIFVGAVLKI